MLGDLPVWPEAYHADAGSEAEGLLEKTGAWGHPVLAVFDSWGNVNVPLRLIRRLACNPASEVIVTFGPNWFNRRESLDPDQLDSVFGGREYWEPADREQGSDERWRVWLSTYRAALRRAGFQYQLHFRIVPKTGHPLYLVYGTGHPKGIGVMKDAMWDVDNTDGMGFADPRTRSAPLPNQPAMLWAEQTTRNCWSSSGNGWKKARYHWRTSGTGSWWRQRAGGPKTPGPRYAPWKIRATCR